MINRWFKRFIEWINTFLLKNKINKAVSILILLLLLILQNFVLNKPLLPISPRVDLDAKTWLVFWGSVLGFIGSLFLGIVALHQNKEANNLNKRLLKMQEYINTPIIDMCMGRKIIFKEKDNTEMAFNIIFDIRGYSKKRKNRTEEKIMTFVFKNVGKSHINSIRLVNYEIHAPCKVGAGFMECDLIFKPQVPINYCNTDAFINIDEEFELNILSNYASDLIDYKYLFIDLKLAIRTINNLDYVQTLQIYIKKIECDNIAYEITKRYLVLEN